jgi:uncharacterized protein
MRNITGQAVTGSDFFPRPKEIEKLWRAIESGSHILLAAPRRVGKTSLLFYLLENPRLNYHFVYVITQSIYSEDDFYKRLYEALLEGDTTKGWARVSEKSQQKLKEFIDKINKVEVAGVGVEFGPMQKTDYFKKFKELMGTLKDHEDRIVVMIDEFPEVVENIIEKEGQSAAVEFLKRKREIRQNPAWSENVQFIYTGSIGLSNVVSRMEEMDTINDLHDVTVSTLNREDAKLFCIELLKGKLFKLSDKQIDLLLDKIEWFLPFYIQQYMFTLDNAYVDKGVISEKVIEDVFDEITKMNIVFEHWEERLSQAFKGKELDFVLDVLNEISKNTLLDANEIHDLAVKHDSAPRYKKLLQALIHDGYINDNTASPKIYRFNSPLLRIWWKEHVAN